MKTYTDEQIAKVRDVMKFLARVANVSHNESDIVGEALALLDNPVVQEPDRQCPTCGHEQNKVQVHCNNCGRTYTVEYDAQQEKKT